MPTTRTILPILLALVLIDGCSRENSVSTDDVTGSAPVAASSLDAGLEAIGREATEAHLRYLASDEMKGRMTGTPEYERAAAYIAEQFAAIGLEPGGEDGGWYQEVPMLARRIDPQSATVVFHQDGVEKAQRWKEDFVMGGDVVRPETTVTAEVVFAGFGIHAPEMGYSDYDGIDVEGKILAIFGGAPDTFPHNERAYYSSTLTKATEAVNRGAIGVIGLRSRTDQRRYTWKRISENAGVRPGMSWINLSGQAANYFPELQVSATITVPPAAQLCSRAPISFDAPLYAAAAGKAPATHIRVEDFPAPFAPSNATRSPSAIFSETSRTARTAP